MVYFGLVTLLIVITPIHRFGLANRQTFWLGGLMPILWLVVNGIIANITLYAHQDMLLAVLGTLLLGSSWVAARIDRTEHQLPLIHHHKVAAK